jgi:DNA mismatch repair ATPase MutL
MDAEALSRMMASITSVSKLELQTKATTESRAGCRLRLAGPRVGRT